MGQHFPYPEDPGGDVQNLPGLLPGFLYIDPNTGQPAYAHNDSIWMDLGAPVMTQRNGTKYKPLFAPLIMDLDNRINLNVAGNIRGIVRSSVAGSVGPTQTNFAGTLPLSPTDNSYNGLILTFTSGVNAGQYQSIASYIGNVHAFTFANPFQNAPNVGDTFNIISYASNQGWGPWEVNLAQVLNADPTEWTGLFFGNGTTNGRYGTQGYPGSPNYAQAPGGSGIPHFYGPVDYDGCDELFGF